MYFCGFMAKPFISPTSQGKIAQTLETIFLWKTWASLMGRGRRGADVWNTFMPEVTCWSRDDIWWSCKHSSRLQAASDSWLHPQHFLCTSLDLWCVSFVEVNNHSTILFLTFRVFSFLLHRQLRFTSIINTCSFPRRTVADVNSRRH